MNSEPAPAVTVRDLEKRFGSFVAVNRISFEVPRGEVFGFLGPNGGGKSTTIRMLCGILAPTAGQGSVAGYDVRTQPEMIKANIGYMSQKFSLYLDLTVRENLRFFGSVYGVGAAPHGAAKIASAKSPATRSASRLATNTPQSTWRSRPSSG